MSTITTGAIGTLMRGEEQLGGFLSWEARVDLTNVHRPRILIATRAMWLFKHLEGKDIEAVLYSVVFGKLVITARYFVEMASAPGEIEEDALVYRPLEMVHINELQ